MLRDVLYENVHFSNSSKGMIMIAGYSWSSPTKSVLRVRALLFCVSFREVSACPVFGPAKKEVALRIGLELSMVFPFFQRIKTAMALQWLNVQGNNRSHE